MFKISKEFHFSASHRLDHLPEEHPCHRLHGHNYIIIIELYSPTLNKIGFVKDYRELDFIKKWIDDNLDHRHLNDIFPVAPTAEYMAEYLYKQFKNILPELYSIGVKETEKTIAVYYE